MTTLCSLSHSKVPLFKSKLLCVRQDTLSVNMAQRRKQMKAARALGEEEICDLISDELSDLPTASSSDSEGSVSGSDRGPQNIVTRRESEIDSESSDESASASIAGTATWGKVDKTPTLGKVTGDPGVRQMPSDPTQVSEVAELFFGFLGGEGFIFERIILGNSKHGLLVHVVMESTSGYAGNLEIYSGKGKKLQETIVSILDPYLDQNYHVYQDNFYNSVATAEYLLSRKVHICGTIRVNRGLPPDLKEECKSLKRGDTTFRRKGDILLQSWRDTHVVNMISTIHNSSMIDVQRRHGQVKKPVCISEYNMFMKELIEPISTWPIILFLGKQ
ncbi:hypothetical protein B7P43_G13061 [Cryptotermes secundus]|uniref:PiggyBac transposable element-derived protein domain-containing protein n=1 Tax=Cryptotermes secundus TaxID=105785 RepID=A0A2J7QM68_9NEOP|nr:hypothetical protein B7P43_G13061 [Cryptotermes secundus]PNF29692.1 hypothetical protein B7P43_G13061 [Cryptotermes secundus]